MTPEEKAKELIDKMLQIVQPWEAEQCALIAVNEILETLSAFGYSGAMYDDFETGQIRTTDDGLPEDYWQKVKAEIQKDI